MVSEWMIARVDHDSKCTRSGKLDGKATATGDWGGPIVTVTPGRCGEGLEQTFGVIHVHVVGC
jgi:hypothetical protein